MKSNDTLPDYRSLLEECNELPALVYFEANEGPDAFFVATEYGGRICQQIEDEEIAFAIRDRIEIIPKLVAEVRRLKELQCGLTRYLKPYFDGSKISEGSLWPDSDTILCDFVDEDVFDEVIAPCAVCHSPENDYKHREDHFYKAPVKA